MCALSHGRSPHWRRPDGFTLLELLLIIAIIGTMSGVAIPVVSGAIDEARTAMAARYVEGLVMDARIHAVKRSARIALRFEPIDGDYAITEYLDTNGNGIRTTEIAAGVDEAIGRRQLVREQFPGVGFGLLANVPDVDGARSASPSDGVRVGTSRLLSMGPDGTATSGTLYLHGRSGQYAVRILGATGRTRLLRYDSGTRQWIQR